MGDIKTIEEVEKDSKQNIEILALRRQVAGLKSEIKTMERDYGDLQGYFRDLAMQLDDAKIAPPKQIFKNQLKKGRSRCGAVLHFTDWHYGKVQPPEEIEGFDEFSPEILEAYIDNLVLDFVRWVEIQRNGYEVQDLHIIDTGDNISGDIHQELLITNAYPSPVQAFKCGLLKGRTIAALAPHFENVTVDFITPDNHGRLTRKPQSREAGLNTHNYTVGHISRTLVEAIENVKFNIHTSYTKIIPVSTLRYLITHGHGVMGWAGFPYYGIERLAKSEAMVRLNEPDFNRFNRIIMGHYHAPLKHPEYWIGAAACGTDAYDHQKGRRSRAGQCAWLIHPKHGEFNTVDFFMRPE